MGVRLKQGKPRRPTDNRLIDARPVVRRAKNGRPSDLSKSAQRPGTPPAGSATATQLRSLLGARRGAIAVLAIGSILAGLTETGVLTVLAQTATALVNHASHVRLHFGPVNVDETVGVLLAFGVGLALVRLCLQLMISVPPARIAAYIQRQLRVELFAAFTRASWSEQSRDREGHVQELLSNQVAQANQAPLQAATLVVAATTFLVLVASALVLNVIAALGVLLAATALFALLHPLNRIGARQGRALSREFMSYAGGVNEAVRIAEEAHVFGAGAAQRKRAKKLVAPLSAYVFRTNFLALLVPGVYQSFVYLLVLAALAGIYLWAGGQVASLSAVVLLLVRAGMYGQQVQGAYVRIGQSLPYLERLDEAMRRYTANIPCSEERPLDEVRSLEFHGVGFSYEPGRCVLSDIEFEVLGGEIIGMVGPSGAGKSTLVQLLLRLRAPDSGRYLVNGVSADEFKAEDWHSRFAYVPQEPRLLHATVADNIRFFRVLDDAAVERAARLAGIHDDVMSWAAGYDTVIGPRADAISGGQQQRVCLARALAANPNVLVLDEPTSQLDPISEAVIQQSLSVLRHKLTLFVVAHRMSTLDICERVMVIVDGRLQAFDRIEVLRSDSAYYRAVSEARGASSTIPVDAP